ncbi:MULTISPECIES: isochorismate synthase [Halococcus]|uniref:isochorismate synthase n=1 Tax=Halococcus salifodinae DSM 8989 TaxID=1227456 RepID=M0N3V0_9EURY|nr:MULTISPECIES: isochorismate synthase [Halococcus]EMA52607.1 isochorismate synthase [Halococcus salifodinae DSM 8989]
MLTFVIVRSIRDEMAKTGRERWKDTLKGLPPERPVMEQAGNEGRPTNVAGGRLVSRTREVSDLSFSAFLASQSAPRVSWATPDGFELVGGDAAATLTATGPDRFDTLREDAAALFADSDTDGPPAARPRAIGGLAFDPSHEPAPPWTGFPGALFVVPRVQLTRADDRTWLTVTAAGPDLDPATVTADLDAAHDAITDLPMMRPSGGGPGVTATRRTASKDEWTDGVAAVVERIQAGDLRKVVLATALDVDLASSIDVPGTLERLRRTYPECYRFLVQPTAESGFFGPPPERLVKITGQAVETEALAGSVARGDTPEADAELARSLETSEKIRHEQGVVVDAIRERLAPLGEVRVGERGVRKLANIQHLRTPITATLDDDTHVLDVVEALHPTPAVGGLPPERAREVIHETEPFDRGWYAAPMGWFDAAGDGEFAVGIRSAVAGGRHARLYAGNGIVADSDPDEEWAELGPKFRPVLDELERE